MATISGDVKLVSSRPSLVTEVWVRAPVLRTGGTGVISTANDRFPVEGGRVSFTAEPGPAVLALVAAGRVLESVPILVGDGASQSLRQVVEAAGMADGAELSVLEQVAAQVAADAAAAKTASDGITTRLQKAWDDWRNKFISLVSWSGDRVTVGGKKSPPLTGPRGPQGPPGFGNQHNVDTEAEVQAVANIAPKGTCIWVKDTGNLYRVE